MPHLYGVPQLLVSLFECTLIDYDGPYLLVRKSGRSANGERLPHPGGAQARAAKCAVRLVMITSSRAKLCSWLLRRLVSSFILRRGGKDAKWG